MTSTAFLEQWSSKPFHVSDIYTWYDLNWFDGLSKSKRCSNLKKAAALSVTVWLNDGVITPCKPPKGQHHTKKYYKAVQQPF
jgi:hypothetical protein